MDRETAQGETTPMTPQDIPTPIEPDPELPDQATEDREWASFSESQLSHAYCDADAIYDLPDLTD
jgi:hypothetical protein